MTANQNQSSYPTLQEALRFLAVSFDLKGGNKRIDDKSAEHIDPREVEFIIQELFVNRVQKGIGNEASKFIEKHVSAFKTNYIGLLKSHNADGVTRVLLVDFLNRFLLSHWIADVYRDLYSQFNGPHRQRHFLLSII